MIACSIPTSSPSICPSAPASSKPPAARSSASAPRAPACAGPEPVHRRSSACVASTFLTLIAGGTSSPATRYAGRLSSRRSGNRQPKLPSTGSCCHHKCAPHPHKPTICAKTPLCMLRKTLGAVHFFETDCRDLCCTVLDRILVPLLQQVAPQSRHSGLLVDGTRELFP